MSETDFMNLIENPNQNREKYRSQVPLLMALLMGSAGVILPVITFPFILPFFRRHCIPYVPATTQQVVNVMNALKGRSGKLIDLGSGDGRVVIAAAKNGFESTGVELNFWLVLYSKLISLKSGLSQKSIFLRCDLWKFNLSSYRNVVIFGIESMMEDLEKKILKELKDGSQVVACRFPLPNLKPVRTIGFGIDKVWVYVL